MKILIAILLLSISLLTCKSSEQETPVTSETTPTPRRDTATEALTVLWETDTLLKTVESVIYDAASQFIYTANINGHFMNKDGNGFISKVNLAGEIVAEKWITGLDAPTGLGIYQGKLYTTDIDRIVEIDMAKAAVSNTYAVKGAKAFNDVAVGMDGTVYCSDTGGNQIFALKNGQVVLVKEGIDTPNGLLLDKNRFLVTQWTPRTVSMLDLSSKQLTPFAGGITGTDGLAAIGDGTYLASGFHGLIYHLAADGSKELLLNTSKEQIKAADIDYIISQKTLLIPTMDGNKVMAFKVAL